MLMDLEINRPSSAVTVPCRDVGHRQREVAVTPLLDERVMVTVPPGEVAMFAPREAEECRDALRAAVTGATLEPPQGTTACGSITRTIPCSDAIGRDRSVIITVGGGRVVVAAPPGGIAIFTPTRVGQLCAALRAAIGTAHIGAVTV